MLGLSRPVAECAVCLEIYDDQQGAGAPQKPAMHDPHRLLCTYLTALRSDVTSSAVLIPARDHLPSCCSCGAGDCAAQLEALKLRCMQLLQPFIEGYIWQHGPLSLQSSLQQQPPWASANSKGTCNTRSTGLIQCFQSFCMLS